MGEWSEVGEWGEWGRWGWVGGCLVGEVEGVWRGVPFRATARRPVGEWQGWEKGVSKMRGE